MICIVNLKCLVVKKKTENILSVMNVFAWIAFIGLMVKAGAILVAFGVTWFKPEAAKNLYEGLDLQSLREYSMLQYSISVLMMVTIIILESYTAYLVIKVLSKIKMASPFTIAVANIIERISYFMLVMGGIAIFYSTHLGYMMKEVPGLHKSFEPGEFIFMGGIVFVIAQIFKKGVEIQTENELTV